MIGIFCHNNHLHLFTIFCQKTVKKTQAQITKGHPILRPQIPRKQPTELSKKSEDTDEISQNVLTATPKENLNVPEKKSSVEGDEHTEGPPGALMEPDASPPEVTRKSSTSEVSLEANQSNIHRLTNSNALRMAKRNELREIYFGSSGSDNNVSRIGSAATVIDWNANDSPYPFSGGHNALAQTTWKKATTQAVCISLLGI